jgi:hypothetical protein
MVVAILIGHAPVKGHLYTVGLFYGDPTCRFCRKETETTYLSRKLKYVLHLIHKKKSINNFDINNKEDSQLDATINVY